MFLRHCDRFWEIGGPAIQLFTLLNDKEESSFFFFFLSSGLIFVKINQTITHKTVLFGTKLNAANTSRGFDWPGRRVEDFFPPRKHSDVKGSKC